MNLVIIGAGGQASEVLDVILKSSLVFTKIHVCESTPTAANFLDYEIIEWGELMNKDPKGYLFHVAIGDPIVRARLTESLDSAGFYAQTVISPVASISPSAKIADGCFIGDFSYIGPNVSLGKSVLVNNSVTISHDGVVGDFVTISPGTRINGHVRLGEYSFIGSGVIIKNGSFEKPIAVGANSTIGAGSLVLRDVDVLSTVAGNPAREINKNLRTKLDK